MRATLEVPNQGIREDSERFRASDNFVVFVEGKPGGRRRKGDDDQDNLLLGKVKVTGSRALGVLGFVVLRVLGLVVHVLACMTG